MRGKVRRLRRLLVLLPSTDIGGAERQTAMLAHALAAAGVEIELAAEPALAGALGGLFGTAPHSAAIGWREAEGLAGNLARQAAAAVPLLARLQPDAALLPLPWPTHGLGLHQALTEAGIPSLAVAHLAPTEPEPVPEALAGPIRRGPTAWVAVSGPVAGRLAATLGLPPDRVQVVPNGVTVPPEDPARRRALRRDRRAALHLPGDAPLILFAGRLEETKGAELLPALAERLAEELGGTLVALGAGPLAPRLAAHPAARPGGPLRLPGQVADVGDWMLAADALVIPSRLEGWPLVFLEAAARHCPVVATAAALECLGDRAAKVAALAEIPTIVSLTGHTVAMLRTPQLKHGRVTAAYACAVDYSLESSLSKYFAILRACHVIGKAAEAA
ncbi:glycosyltransferase [Belnapia sp. T6]|uniref:Glycosyltransferase n=1 Tax=Belnapia mucosa TaxID=2804532 RepID=A0ABS1V772_9PROT|nr:glycosyltransferase family 4 protein [Belnapia mucosa]MBL6457026.1 glycosyltransferase [Belnapia mucosa]